MRIIGGTAKGRRLASFKGMHIRPTTDRVREAIFNILPRPFPFRDVLDLFAGTGAMGMEALSRGAETAAFIDDDPKAVSVIKKNLGLCKFTDRAVVICNDVQSSLNLMCKRGARFDLIFIDPPYSAPLMGAVLNYIDDKKLLDGDGLIVAESSKRMVWDGKLENTELFDRRRYGDTIVSFYMPKSSKTRK